MEKIIMLGTGNGITLDLYNTCFVIQNDEGNFLVDTGGSIEILKRLNKVNINLNDIKHIFISHSHTDHIFGLIWMFKKLHGVTTDEKIKIYCNDVVYEAIREISKLVFPDRLMDKVLSMIDFHILENNQHIEINGVNYTFFDINAKGTKQFGFECIINNKKLIFLGDEPLNSNLYGRVKGADYVMHEAFCLDSEQDIFKPYEKNHSTAKSTGLVMNDLDVKNLILYHTEDSHGIERKKLYTEEAKKYFKGNVIVPDDLEVIDLKNEICELKTKNRILITGTVLTANNDSIDTYNKLISLIDNTKFQISTPLDTMEFKGTDLERYERAMNLLKDTKLLIAEMSNPSTGQGMELQEAIRLNIPILIIAKNESKISSLIKGCRNVKHIIYYNDVEDIYNNILNFIEEEM